MQRLNWRAQWSPAEAQHECRWWVRNSLGKKVERAFQRLKYRWHGAELVHKSSNRPSRRSLKVCRDTWTHPVSRVGLRAIGRERGMQVTHSLRLPTRPGSFACMGMVAEFMARALRYCEDASTAAFRAQGRYFSDGASADALFLQSYYNEMGAFSAYLGVFPYIDYYYFIGSLMGEASGGLCQYPLMDPILVELISQYFSEKREELQSLREFLLEEVRTKSLLTSARYGTIVKVDEIHRGWRQPRVDPVYFSDKDAVASVWELFRMTGEETYHSVTDRRVLAEAALSQEEGVYQLRLPGHGVALVIRSGRPPLFFDPNYACFALPEEPKRQLKALRTFLSPYMREDSYEVIITRAQLSEASEPY